MHFLDSIHPPFEGNARQNIFAWVVVSVSMLAGVMWTIYLYLESPGVPVQDELAHFFISRDAWAEPELILNSWGRTINTLIYMPGAYFGFDYARISSIAMAFFTVLLSMLLAKQLGARYAFLVPAVLWFQPWFADLSYTAITEVPFSLLMVAAACLFTTRRFGACALIVGLLPLVRHEGIALVGLCTIYFLYKRHWRLALISVVPLLLYNIIYYLVLDEWVFAVLYLNPKPTEFYGHGTWSHFIPGLAKGVGIMVCFLAANGFGPMIRNSVRVKILVFYLTYFLLQVVIYRLGLFSSGGYVLFLLPIAPGLAVAAVFGLEFIVQHGLKPLSDPKTSKKRIGQLKAVFFTAVFGTILVLGFETNPRPMDEDGRQLQRAAQWLDENGHDAKKIIYTHVWLRFFIPDINRVRARFESTETIPEGTILVWDSHYSNRSGWKFEDLRNDQKRWKALQMFGGGRVIIFEKRTD